MEKLSNCIQAKYIGRRQAKDDWYINPFLSRDHYHEKKPPIDVYMIPLIIDGKEAEVYFSTWKEENRDKRRGRNVHDVITLDTYFFDSEKESENYRALNEENKTYMQETEIGKAGDTVRINLAETTIDTDLPDKELPYKEIEEKIMRQLCEKKRKIVFDARKKSFEERFPDVQERFNSILSRLNDQEKEKAKKLYTNMVFCLITGKYNLNDFAFFMNNLEKAAKSQVMFYQEKNCIFSWDVVTPFNPLSRNGINGINKESLDVRKDYIGRNHNKLNVLDIRESQEWSEFISLPNVLEMIRKRNEKASDVLNNNCKVFTVPDTVLNENTYYNRLSSYVRLIREHRLLIIMNEDGNSNFIMRDTLERAQHELFGEDR